MKTFRAHWLICSGTGCQSAGSLAVRAALDEELVKQALEREDWTAAVQQLNAALEKKGDSSARARSYGMNVVEYFPYFRLGVAYYHLGQFDAALQAFETEARLGAITESESANAELAEFRVQAQEARLAQAAERARRIQEIVQDSLAEAARLEREGQIEAAIAAVDMALAVAPEDADALAKVLLRGNDPKTALKGEMGVAKGVAWSDPIPLADVVEMGHATGNTVKGGQASQRRARSDNRSI